MKKIKGKNVIGQLLILTLILTIVLSGCGSKDAPMMESTTTEETKSEPKEASRDESYGESDTGERMESPSSQDMDDVALEDSEVSTIAKSDNALANQVDARKYIRTFRYYMETLTFDETEAELNKLVDLNFGFYQSSETQGRAINSSSFQRRTGTYTIRIPKEKVAEFTKGVEGIGHILNKNNFVEDVTGQYFDMEARIKTLRVQEERLLAILEKATELEYIIELERELSSVTYEIESYMTSFKELENQINYSTVYVELYEVFEETVIEDEKPATFFEEMEDGFKDSVEDVIDFFKGLILFLTTNIPLFILLGVIGFILYKIVKRLIKPKRLVIREDVKIDSSKVDIRSDKEKEE